MEAVLPLPPGLEEILKQGLLGLIIAYLLYENRDLKKRLQKCQEDWIADLKSVSTDTKAAFATSTEVLRANTIVQERSTGTVSRFGEQLLVFQSSLDRVRDMLDRGSRERQS